MPAKSLLLWLAVAVASAAAADLSSHSFLRSVSSLGKDVYSGGTCAKEGGVCINTGRLSCSAATESGKCPGGKSILCCPQPNGFRAPKCDTYQGLCKRTGQTCRGGFLSLQCPGPSNVQCCQGAAVPSPAPSPSPQPKLSVSDKVAVSRAKSRLVSRVQGYYNPSFAASFNKYSHGKNTLYGINAVLSKIIVPYRPKHTALVRKELQEQMSSTMWSHGGSRRSMWDWMALMAWEQHSWYEGNHALIDRMFSALGFRTSGNDHASVVAAGLQTYCYRWTIALGGVSTPGSAGLGGSAFVGKWVLQGGVKRNAARPCSDSNFRTSWTKALSLVALEVNVGLKWDPAKTVKALGRLVKLFKSSSASLSAPSFFEVPFKLHAADFVGTHTIFGASASATGPGGGVGYGKAVMAINGVVAFNINADGISAYLSGIGASLSAGALTFKCW